MSKWTEGWEQTPAGSYKASYTAQAITDLLYEFRVRMSAQHVWDATTSPKCYHEPGSGIVQVGESVGSNSKVGGMQYNSSLKQLWRDNGATLDGPIGGLDHGVFTINVLATTAHDQYGLVTAAQTYTNLGFALKKIKGLPTTDSGFADTYVISRKVHKGYSATTHAKHADDCITYTAMNTSGAKLGSTKFPIAAASTVYSGTLGMGASATNNAMPNVSFAPYMSACSADDVPIIMMPGFYASTASFPASTSVVLSVFNWDNAGRTFTIKVRSLA